MVFVAGGLCWDSHNMMRVLFGKEGSIEGRNDSALSIHQQNYAAKKSPARCNGRF